MNTQVVKSAALSLLFAAGVAHAYTTDPVTGCRIFRFTPDSEEFTSFKTTWQNNAAYYFKDGDVYEFEESNDPYVFTRSSFQGSHLRIAYRGVKADGTPADPAKVVFVPDSDSADYNIRGGVTNVFENITFSNMPIYVQCDFNAISNCVFTGMQKRAAVYGQFAVNASYERPGWSAWATDCRFEDASHSSVGAAMSLYEFAATNCVFAGNINNNGSIGGGGAIGTVGNLSCCNCIFANNRTTGMYGGAIHLTNTGTVALDRCVFTNNCANQTYNRNDSCGGGALSVVAAVSGYIRNCIFVGNYITTEIGKNSYDGGAIRIRHASASISIENCTFANNTITVGGTNKDVGGALAATQGAVGVTNCIFYANHGMLGTTSWRTSHLSVPDWSLVANCLEANFEEGGTTYDFSSIDTGATPTTHIINGVNGNKVGDYDPLFTDAANGDYTLQIRSPCRKAGDASIWGDGAQDLAGNDRVTVRGSNRYVDMGCYQVDEDYRGARVRGRIFLPEGVYYQNIWRAFDGGTSTANTGTWTISGYAIYDVGRPMVVNTFGLLARPGYGARSKNYAWYGTNDKDDVATNGIANATFLFNTGTDITASTDYTNFYSSASSEAFRYYCYAPRGNEEANYHFMFFSEDAQIHQNLLHTLSSDSVGGVEPSTIPFTGTLAYWPYATTPKIRVMVSPVEHEYNYNAWAADAQTRVFESVVAYSQGDSWSVDVANLPQGRWHARAFAVDGERKIAAHTSVAFATGTKPYYPAAYYPTGIGANAFKTYDSLINAYAEVSGTQRIVFKLDDPRVEIVGFRIWARTGDNANWVVRVLNGRLRVTNDEGDMGEVTDYTGVTTRSLHYAEKEPEGVTWTDCLRLQELDLYASRTEAYYAEYPVTIPVRHPTYICFDKFSYYQFREIEFRTLPRPTGSVYYIR